MKKIFILIITACIYSHSFAQIQNSGMETWRNYISGGVFLQAPNSWYSSDSVVASFVAQYGALFGYFGVPNQQLFRESSVIYAGSYSAKLVTIKQDTLGVLPEAMSNGQPHFDLPMLIATHDPQQSIQFSGGTPVSSMIYGVSAWVEYSSPGNDSGVIIVEAIKNFSGTDSVIGYGYKAFVPVPIFTKIDAPITYIVPNTTPDTIRIVFLSSNIEAPVEGSTLYVDDVAFDLTTAVSNVAENDAISIVPIPSSGIFYMKNAGNDLYDVHVISESGQTVYTKQVAGNGQIDLSTLPSGIYFYNLTGKDGNIRQGKLTLVK